MLMDPAKANIANFIAVPSIESQSAERNLSCILHAVRTYLNLEMAFISEFTHGQRVFRYIDGEGPEELIKVGDGDPLEASFCQRVVDGRLPQLIPDAMRHPEAERLAKAAGMNIGAHVSVPIRLKSGDIYGTFCCFSFTPDEHLNERDLAMIKVFAELAGTQIDQELENQSAMIEPRQRIEAVLTSDALRMVYQPIVSISDNAVVGFESLARFATEPNRPPDQWFNEAASVGHGTALEIKAILLGLSGLTALPQDTYISVNASPSTILSIDPEALFEKVPPERIVLEITEHAIVQDYSKLHAVIQPFRERGIRLAVDDAGAGYASFRHILRLAPDIIKVDASITRDIDTQLSRRALAAAIIGFASETDTTIIAEGVETEGELAALQDLGVTKVQGFFFHKPMVLEDAITLGARCSGNAQP